MVFMKKELHFITFSINKETKIIVPLQDPIEFLGPIYEENILLHNNNHTIVISNRTIYHDMLDLVDILKKALNNELPLHPSISQDIGYLYNYNHYNSNDTSFVAHVFDTGIIRWIGYLYHLWESNCNFDSWIYNAPDGSIVFEITPFYPYMYCEPEEEPNYIPYEEWIKTYKPYFITTLSKETALEWIEQAEKIIWMVEFNEKRMQYRSKIDVES